MTSSYAAGRPSGTINSGKYATRSPFVDWSTDVASWMDEGLCVGTSNPDLFYCRDDGRDSPARIEAAKTTCHSCPVEARCLEWAVKQEEDEPWVWGVWGGKSADERRKIRQERRKSKTPIVVAVAPRKPPSRQGQPGGPKCGSEAGAKVHHRNGEHACYQCREATTQARRRRDERRSA